MPNEMPAVRAGNCPCEANGASLPSELTAPDSSACWSPFLPGPLISSFPSQKTLTTFWHINRNGQGSSQTLEGSQSQAHTIKGQPERGQLENDHSPLTLF